MGRDVETVRSALPRRAAWAAVARYLVRGTALSVRGRVHQPRDAVGRLVRFADGSEARIYRETRVDAQCADPCVLLVTFRLRVVHGRGHGLFRAESLLNTPLFVGFPGFVSKLWVAHDDRDRYRGIYQWDGTDRAESYVRALWRVLALVSHADSIDYRVLPGARRAEVLAGHHHTGEDASSGHAWWQVVPTA